jgi:phosphoenolpyruvate-protein kinase (PTS system EI component)
MSNLQIQGIPYAPGCVQGRLQQHSNSTTDQDILLLSQNELPSLRIHKPAGLIVIDGAPYSHGMIQQLRLGIPLVIISAPQADLLPANSYLQIDGNSGVIKTITSDTVLAYEPPPAAVLGHTTPTADGVDVYLNASVSGISAATLAVDNGAAAIGLVRSEFLQPPQAQTPDSGFYLHAFTAICEAAQPLAVTVRLLDLAPDKKPPWLPKLPGMQGPSGLQGVRLYRYAAMEQVVHAQLAVIDQLATRFQIRLLVPFVTTNKEFQHWRDTIKSMISTPTAVGAMLEIPAAVLDIRSWLHEADFVSIGCNDLMQNLFAADRDLPQLQRYLNPYTPALFRFLRQTAISAGDRINKIQLCGLLPQWPGILPVLVGMGYTSYSCEPLKIPYLAQSIRATTVKKLQPVVELVCNAPDAQEVCRLLDAPVWPE